MTHNRFLNHRTSLCACACLLVFILVMIPLAGCGSPDVELSATDSANHPAESTAAPSADVGPGSAGESIPDAESVPSSDSAETEPSEDVPSSDSTESEPSKDVSSKPVDPEESDKPSEQQSEEPSAQQSDDGPSESKEPGEDSTVSEDNPEPVSDEPEPQSLYDKTKEGGLLYQADFRGDEQFDPELTYLYQTEWGKDNVWSVSKDGKSVSMKGCSFVSGELKDLPLDKEHSYTIAYTAEFSDAYIVIQGLYVDLDEHYSYGATSGKIGYNGFRSAYNSYAFAQDGFNYAIGGSEYLLYASDPSQGICPYTEKGEPQDYLGTAYATVRHRYRLVVNGPTETLDYYVLAKPASGSKPVWKQLYSIRLKDVGSSFKSGNLHLAFQSYYLYNSLSVVYSDVSVYKGFADAGAETESVSGDEAIPGTENRLSASTPGVTVLGVRNLQSANSVHMDWSCSGVSFSAVTKAKGISFGIKTTAPCYFRLWVDGKERAGDTGVYHTVSPSKKCIVLSDLPVGQHSFKLMKVTGYTLARAELEYVKMDGTIVAGDAVRKSTYIEFVGDSITCGWGTIGNRSGAYTDQDGTLAYAYLLVQKLDADYSMTALSGQGLLTGNPGFPKGYLYASALKDDKTAYSFGRKADLTVLLLGPGGVTSDFNEQELINAYVKLIRLVQEKNGGKVLCLYNAMTDYYTTALLAACDQCGGESKGVYSFKLDRAKGNAHPSQAEHQAYCAALLPLCRQLLGK